MRNSSVILLSGGLDSAANLALSREWDEPVLALTFRYGQKAAEQEIRAAKLLCKYYEVPHEVVDLEWLGNLGNSSLTQKEKALPRLEIQQLDDRSVTEESARAVWVPNRNGIFIHVAAAYAESLKAPQVVVGFNIEEAATFPDNSAQYVQRVTSALELSTSTQVRVFSYTARWTKAQIVVELEKMSKSFPFELIWSCYEGGEAPCRSCESCQRFLRSMRSLRQNDSHDVVMSIPL